MRSRMGFQVKRELLLQTGTRYREAIGKAKTTILDEFILSTGYDRKYAIRLLNRPSLKLPGSIKRPRAGKYGTEVQSALAVAWAATNFICAKRLVPFLPELVPSLERHGHLVLTPEVREQLLSVSAATVDRLLKPNRQSGNARGLSTTKPGKLLKHQIPIRTFTDWEDTQVGFFEMDLVAHCGGVIAGTFLWTLVLTDVASGWTECFPLLHRSGKGVVQGVQYLQEVLPFPILGLDSDNGSEFINDDVLGFCKAQKITFTRGRAHRKNDQCFVEQKNGSIVRQIIGYDRYDGLLALQQLSELYRALRLYVNIFQPSMKLKTKKRDGAKVHRKYSPAQTPLQRAFGSNILSAASSEKFEQLRTTLDPVMLLRVLQTLQDAFWRHANVVVESIQAEGEGEPSCPTLLFDLEACLPGAERPPTEDSVVSERRYRRSRKPRKPRTHRTRRDPFEGVETQLKEWFLSTPQSTAKGLLERLQRSQPGVYPDLLQPLKTLTLAGDRWPATHLYYFATPPIFVGNRESFSTSVFCEFCRYYVEGFVATIEAAASVDQLFVLYPSSVAVVTTPRAMGEYAAAK
ncbi:MAG TPA: transposase, partial [Myxococcales bacterium]|nr:transposase [Myxococcales bacterium]